MTPFFSIIIPVYNVAPYLRECLDSVLAQTFTEWEAICVDDGSSDGSGAILDEYAAVDARFKVIHQKNAGVSEARNVALDMAIGAWIGFVDADDMIKENWLKDAYLGIMKYPTVSWVSLGYTARFPDGCPQQEIVHSAQKTRFVDSRDVPAEAWQYVSAVGLLCVHFLRRMAVGPQRFNANVRIKEDSLFVLSIVLGMQGDFLELPNNGYLYRQRNGSASRFGAGSRSVCAFQTALNYLWRKYPTNRKAFSLLTLKNLRHWAKKGEALSKGDVDRVREAIIESKKIKGLNVLSLPLLDMVRIWALVHLHFWRG